MHDSQIPNCCVSHDDCTDMKLVYMVPYENEKKMSLLLSKLESFPDVTVAIEMTSLEDAYLKIVASESEAKDDVQIQNEQVMNTYQYTQGDSSFFSQFAAMFCRRFIVFIREPRQWFLTVSPFINVLTTFLILYSVLDAAPDKHKELARKVLNYVVAIMFPYILNAGYATCSGIYMLMPIEERMKQTRHILKMSGLKTPAYWLGLFTADYILFMIPTALFVLLVMFSGLQIFGEYLGIFIGGMLSFGFAVISLTYLLSTFFSTQDAAIKCNIILQLLVGTLLPLIIITIVGGATKSGFITECVFTALFMINPLFTFYLTNYMIVITYINHISPDSVPDIYIPLVYGVKASFKLSMMIFFGQFVFFMSLTMLRDHCMSSRFRSKAKRSVKIEQPQMQVHDDVRQHEIEMQ